MFAAIAIVFLQVTAPGAPPVAQAPAIEEVAAAAVAAEAGATNAAPEEEVAEAQPAAAVIPEGMMDCDYNRQTRLRMCTTSEGEVLRCRRERTLGSRFSTWVCFTYAEDQQIQRDSQQALDRAQHISTPGGG